MNCVSCDSLMASGIADWHYQCRQCGYEASSLAPTINQSDAHDNLDEADRETSLKSLRLQNFKTIIARLNAHVAPGARSLLDVGSAHGWFLEVASARYAVTGIEPDERICIQSRKKGFEVRCGFFPDELLDDEQFDLISFNDVIEHIPSIDQALKASREHLRPDGLLILNIPSSDGFFYRLSKYFVRIFMRGPFERMWQKGLPSPHVHYFRSKNLIALLEKSGFKLVEIFELPAIHKDGLLERLRCVGNSGPLKLYTQFILISCIIPVLRLFSSDTIVGVFRKVA